MPGHVGGYLPPYFKSKMKGTTSIPSHTWVEGLILYYLLSCDESVREAIEQTRSWLLQDEKLNFYDFSNCREAFVGTQIAYSYKIERSLANYLRIYYL